MSMLNEALARPAKLDGQKRYDPKRIGKTWDEIVLGERLCDYPKYIIQLSPEMVHAFAELTGDSNPIHVDENFAQRTVHRGCIAHGQLLTSLALGRYHHSGFGYGTTVALSATMAYFLRPARDDDQLYFESIVVGKDEKPTANRGLVTFLSWLRRADNHLPILEIVFDVVMTRAKTPRDRRRLGLPEEGPIERKNPVWLDMTIGLSDHPPLVETDRLKSVMHLVGDNVEMVEKPDEGPTSGIR
ncbi:MAG: MaoC family dehydratase [Planctomycetota bacterium]